MPACRRAGSGGGSAVVPVNHTARGEKMSVLLRGGVVWVWGEETDRMFLPDVQLEVDDARAGGCDAELKRPSPG